MRYSKIKVKGKVEMKKIASILLCIVVLMSLAACGGNEKEPVKNFL